MNNARPRRWQAALAGAGLLATAAWLWLGDHEPAPAPRPRAEAIESTGRPSTPPSPSPVTAAVAAVDRGKATPPEAERVLRELDELAAHDKPRALALAIVADARLSDEGVLAEARRALIITLLVDTQRSSEARERTRDFIRRYPQSSYLPLVKGVTGIHPRPRPSELRDARSR